MALKKIFLPLCCVAVFAMQAGTLSAQTTIGSHIPPNTGALLDLKQWNQTGANSNKGLLLPRVIITDLTDITKDITGVNTGNADGHIGLMVYNLNIDHCIENPISKGVHIWSGKKWEYLGPEVKNSEVKVFEDNRDGNKYFYRSFGTAGTWMLENMRAKRFEGSANDIPIYVGSNNDAFPQYAYIPVKLPNGTPTPPDYWATPDPVRIGEGLLYNWYAASNIFANQTIPAGANYGEKTPAAGNEVENDNRLNGPDTNGYYVQGICPNGWHLPSDREWNRLEKEIYENITKYSTYTDDDEKVNPELWQPAWNSIEFYRGSSSSTGHSIAMLNVCKSVKQNGGAGELFTGKSLPAAYGGFDVPIAGYANSNSFTEDLCGLWTSSPQSGANVYVRLLFNVYDADNIKVDRTETGHYSTYMSVRCKKNE